MQLQHDHIRSAVIDRISSRQSGWATPERRAYLERLGTLTAGSKVRVRFLDIPTAACEWVESGRYHRISFRSQPLDLSYIKSVENALGSETIHTLVQEGLLYHELGHVLMSDYDAWSAMLDEFDSLLARKSFKHFLNQVEDVVIEAWMREWIDCGRVLDFKNMVKFHTLYKIPGRHDSIARVEEHYDQVISTKMDATLAMIESLGRYDGGFLDLHGDDLPEIREFATRVISFAVREPDARARYEGVRDMYDDFFDGEVSRASEEFEESGHASADDQSAGPQQMMSVSIPTPGDGDSQDGSDESDAQSAEGAQGGQEASDESGTDDAEGGDESSSAGSQGAQEDDSPDESSDSNADESGVQDDAGDDEFGMNGAGAGFEYDELESITGDSEIMQEDDSNPDADDEVERLVQAAIDSGADSGQIEVGSPRYINVHKEWETTASRYARQLGSILTDHFRHERQTRENRNRHSGDFDSRALIRADRGDSSVFVQHNNPEDKRYHCVICVDDSGSMRGEAEMQASITTGMLVQALDAVGIATTVYTFADQIRLTKMRDEEYEDVTDEIYTDSAGSGTNLSGALEAIQKMEGESDEEMFLVVITDGMPRDEERAYNILSRLRMRSICIQIELEDTYFRDVYDGWVVSQSVSDIPSQVQSAFRRVML